MVYLLSLALFVVLLGFAPKESGLHRNNHKYYMIVSGIAVTLVMGFRSRYTGSGDTYTYSRTFETLRQCEAFGEYFEAFLSDTEFIFSETGFYWLVWLLTRLTDEPQWMIFLTSVFITWASCSFLYKNSEDPTLALLVYICLGLFTFNMNGMRQAMAMSVCVLSYELVKKRKLLPFLLMVLVAMQFHKTAFAFLPVYLLPTLKNTKGNWFFYICGMGVFLLLMDQIIVFFNDATGKEYEVGDSFDSGGVTVIMIYVLAIGLSVLIPQALDKRDIRCALFGTIAGLAIYAGRYFSQQILERVSYYYFYFVPILISGIISDMEEREQKVVRVLFIFASLALFAYRTYSGMFRYFGFFF